MYPMEITLKTGQTWVRQTETNMDTGIQCAVYHMPVTDLIGLFLYIPVATEHMETHPCIIQQSIQEDGLWFPCLEDKFYYPAVAKLLPNEKGPFVHSIELVKTACETALHIIWHKTNSTAANVRPAWYCPADMNPKEYAVIHPQYGSTCTLTKADSTDQTMWQLAIRKPGLYADTVQWPASDIDSALALANQHIEKAFNTVMANNSKPASSTTSNQLMVATAHGDILAMCDESNNQLGIILQIRDTSDNVAMSIAVHYNPEQQAFVATIESNTQFFIKPGYNHTTGE